MKKGAGTAERSCESTGESSVSGTRHPLTLLDRLLYTHDTHTHTNPAFAYVSAGF